MPEDINLLTSRIIGIFYKVYNTLGYGFLEKVYENAMCVELLKSKVPFKKQYPIPVHYQTQLVGKYFADIIVEDRLIVELKASEFVSEEHEYQLLNYLKATEIEYGLLLNFGKKPEVRRKIFNL